MSLEAIYRGRRARVVEDLVEEVDHDYCDRVEHLRRRETGEDCPGGGWTGVILDYGDGLTFGVRFGDPELVIDPDDAEWSAALEKLPPILGGTEVRLPDGTTARVFRL